MTEKERRTVTTKIEVRTIGEEGKPPVIEGYALKFDSRSEELGLYDKFVETLARGCLDNTDMTNVVALYNHDENYPLARNTVSDEVGKLELKVDDVGLFFRMTPTQTSYASDLLTNIKAGVVSQCSFAFSLGEDGAKWRYDKDTDLYERTVTDIKRLYDVSIVTRPAYPDTEAAPAERALKDIKDAELKQIDDEKRKRALAIELELMEG